MFTITYRTFNDIRKDISVIDENYAYFIFKSLIQAIDAERVDMIDGFTGEVIMEWKKGEYTVINRCVVD